MLSNDSSPAGRRKTRRARLLVFLFIGILGGVVVGGYVLDESPPNVRDLALPVPTVGEVDPFTWFAADPLSAEDLASLTILSESSSITPFDPIDGDDQPELLRKRLRQWFAEFEAEFSRTGGDPNQLDLPRFDEGPLTIGIDEGNVEPPREGARPRVSFSSLNPIDILLAASTLELQFDDGNQAFAYLSLALRIETWILIYHSEGRSFGRTSFSGYTGGGPARLNAVLTFLTTLIEGGHLSSVSREAVFDGLVSWELPPSAFEGITARFFRDRCEELVLDEHWGSMAEGDPPKFRFKKNRTIRRLAEHVRLLREALYTPQVVGDAETSPLVEAWIDPYGDRILQAELDYLDHLHEESFFDPWRKGKLIVWAIAIHRYELAHGDPPRTLEDLVPSYLPAIPEIPGAKQSPRYEGRMLQFEVGQQTYRISIPKARE